MRGYHFHITCVDSTAELIDEMCDQAREVTYATMLRNCEELVEFAVDLGYYRRGPGLTLRRDWGVSFHKSRYAGQPCYYFVWSGIEHVWLAADCDWDAVHARERETRRESFSLRAEDHVGKRLPVEPASCGDVP